ncbi:MAG: sensor histidine kinase [Acidimicrobiales bacterium]
MNAAPGPARRSWARRPVARGPVNLRRRLTLTMAVMLVIGLVVADIVTYSSLHSSLYGRLDAQLDAAQNVAYRYLVYAERTGRPPTGEGLDNRLSADVYAELLDHRGQVVVSRPSGSPFHPEPPPVLSRLRVAASPAFQRFERGGAYRPNPFGVDVGAVGVAGFHYRAEAVAVPQGTLVTAVSLGATLDTLDSVLRVEVLVSLAVLLGLCVLALWTIRRGLRPLETMTETAGAIGSGDLTRRIDTTPGDTEVGRLAAALNAMLSQIESAFAEKSASEARLRQFVADASHELRTPLTSIRGYAELLRKGAFKDEDGRQRALARVEHEAARMGGLVDDLLLLARLDQGRPLRRVPVDLRRVAADAVDDARAVDPERPIDLLAPEPLYVTGDPDALGQVLHNLVRNALSHTPAGTRVTVEIGADATSGTIRVTDDGPGITATAARRVFDRFYRGDAARHGGGTGLGLAIVWAIARALDGTARVESTPGEGASFVVVLPRASAPPVDGRARRPAQRPAEPATPGPPHAEPLPAQARRR